MNTPFFSGTGSPRLHQRRQLATTAALLVMLLGTACGDGSSGDPAPAALDSVSLSIADVNRVLAQGVAEAQARQVKATFAVTDRVGNVLAVYQMAGAGSTVDVVSGLGVNGGLDGVLNTIPATLAAISKALTGAYLSSSGNAFSTRTASQIIQKNFNPQEASQPSGPLYGVQFSQLPCSDLVRRFSDGSIGPKHSPLGLSGDPGGLPLYKNGVVVGGVGVVADGVYGIDLDITDVDNDTDELIAVAASSSYSAPQDIRGNRITADGRSFRYVDSEAIRTSPAAASVATLVPGEFKAVTGYSTAAARAGIAMGTPGSGIRPDSGALSAVSAWVLTDAADNNRYPPIDSISPATALNGMTQQEVTQLLLSALDVANHARAQIRRPLGSAAQVTVTVVDTSGTVLGLGKTPDAPLFGVDVALQKARTASFFSSASAGAALQALPPAAYINGPASPLAAYVTDARNFFSDALLLTGNTAFSARALGNIHRPTFPDGIAGTPHGPFSKSAGQWSPFNVGLQLDLVYNQLLQSVVAADFSEGCTGIASLKNGIQIFPGAVPIYRGTQLIGAIGVSGDGVDQDDMVALLGLGRASRILAGSSVNPIGNAPAAMRADTLSPQGIRLRYAQCPQSPFNGSSAQNVCAGL
ncbi:MAG: heme-binding protein [bacterium]|nr:heme-binding protein [bacterium]